MNQKDIEKYYQERMGAFEKAMEILLRKGRKQVRVAMGSGLWIRRMADRKFQDIILEVSDTLTLNLDITVFKKSWRGGKKLKVRVHRDSRLGLASYKVIPRKPAQDDNVLLYPSDIEYLAKLPFVKFADEMRKGQ